MFRYIYNNEPLTGWQAFKFQLFCYALVMAVVLIIMGMAWCLN